MPRETVILFGGVVAVLCLASVIGAWLKSRPGGSTSATVENLNARVKAWWVMVALLGVAIAAVVIGDRRLATAEGIVSYSLVFTLWSFLGLLTLPTPSRRGVAEVDQNLLAAGCPPEVMARTIAMLDDLQDRERQRGPFIEVIFHPVPSVQSRLRGPRAAGVKGCWDAARSAVYMSIAGLGLLGRAVHCNCGRPSLWVFLPID
jgi:hypothetical protein